jgi:hypothetical protein
LMEELQQNVMDGVIVKIIASLLKGKIYEK